MEILLPTLLPRPRPYAHEIGSQHDELVQGAFFYREYEDLQFQLLSQTRQTVPWMARPALDDEIRSQVLPPIEDEAAWPQLVETISWTPRPALDDEIGGQPFGNFSLEQEELYKAPQLPPIWVPRPALDDEILQPATFFFLEQEEPQPGWPSAEMVPWTARPFSDDEIGGQPFGNFGLEYEDAWPQLKQTIAWASFFVADEDPRVQFVAPIFDDEMSGPPVFVEAVPWMARPFLDDETGGQPFGNFGLEFEDAWPQRVEALSWLAIPFADDEIRSPGIIPVQSFFARYKYLPVVPLPILVLPVNTPVARTLPPAPEQERTLPPQ